MFLSSLSKTCEELGLLEDSKQFSDALSSILSAASHTNNMIWIGKMENCPLDLSGQGQLLKQGRVVNRLQGGRKWNSQKRSASQLFLFQKTLLLCKTTANQSEPNNPHLLYDNHIRYSEIKSSNHHYIKKIICNDFSLNQVRIRDVVADDENIFEVHKLEHLKAESSGANKSGIVMRLECESEDAKNEWVKAINSEVKHLRSTLKYISNQLWIL
jgi:hypothetical protein